MTNWSGSWSPCPFTASAIPKFQTGSWSPERFREWVPNAFNKMWCLCAPRLILWKSCSHRCKKNKNQLTISYFVQSQFVSGLEINSPGEKCFAWKIYRHPREKELGGLKQNRCNQLLMASMPAAQEKCTTTPSLWSVLDTQLRELREEKRTRG